MGIICIMPPKTLKWRSSDLLQSVRSFFEKNKFLFDFFP